jgi:predicted phosphodiesterase
VYELTSLGYHEQKKHAIRLLSEWKTTPIYLIDGNHDRWYIKSNGAHIVSDVCEAIPNAHWLGHDMGSITLAPGVDMMLWHGEDGGGSYALSYRLQKIVESLKGGQKPAILAAGHDHKAGYFFIRNIHCYAGGCLQGQSSWMRGKRLAAHEGFWILTVTIGKGSVRAIESKFFPYYD